MPRMSPATMLEKSLGSLMAERQEAQDTLARIDSIFNKFGITVGTPTTAKAGRPAKVAKRAYRRKQFGQTAHEFVLGLLKGKSMTTAEVNAAWKKEGRGANAGTALTQLFQDKKIKRERLKGEKGSKYSAA